jgi:exopolysaccharide biosynthesis polyprenyl glycosylphosphotransferase
MASTHHHPSSILGAVAEATPRRPFGIVWRPSMMQLAVDILAFTISFAVYQMVRPLILSDVRVFSLADHAAIAAVSCAFWCMVFWLGGLYRDYYIRSPFEEFFALFRVSFLGSVTIFLLIFFGSSEDFQSNPRYVFGIYWFVLFGLAAIGRITARQLQRRFRERGIITIPTVLIGTRERLAELLIDLRDEPAWGYDVLGVVEVGGADASQATIGVARLGTTIDDVPTVVRALRPREVLVTMDHTDHDALLKVTAQAADEGALVRIVPDLYEIFSGQARTQQIYGSPLIEVSPELMQPWEEFAKRTTDIVVSLLILGLGLPVWLLTALAVKVTSKGPMFFVQARVGKNGSVFRMAKFRSMYTDDRRGPTWTEENDPRVTPIGRFIRKTHLDEIPQLWNVLKGEMSLVGPRPEQPHYVDKFTQMLPYYRRRHKVRPGVTGWWQVKVKSNPESLEEIKNRLRYDFFYIENMSFKLDLEIMVRTVFVMLRGHGRA